MDDGVFLDSYSPAFGRVRQLIARTFRRSEITRITRQLSVLIEGRIGLLEALGLAREQLKDKTLTSVFDSVIRMVESGKSLASALVTYPLLFDDLYVSMVESGELSGRLDLAFDRIAVYREKNETTTRKVRSALAYPAMVVMVAVIVVAGLVFYVIPVFSSMYANFGAELPLLTRRLVGISGFLKDSFRLWAPGLFLLVCGLLLATTTQRFRRTVHRVLVRMPPFRSLIVKLVAARFCRTIGSLLISGVSLVRALQIGSRTTGNSYAAVLLQPAESRLVQGKSFTEALEGTGLFPRMVLRLAASGEKTGRLGQMLCFAADYYEKETESEITTLTALVEPVVIIVLGVFIALVLVAMYLPLFDLVGAL
jgi:type IV pilus assembly protein PilC